jgi:uncharacterized membrane protein
MTPHAGETIARETRAGPGRPGPAAGSSWGVPVALVLLSLVPVTAGVLRTVEILGGPQLLPDNPRVDASPAPAVVHVVAAATYALVGSFQFSARFRRRHPDWHAKAGRVLVGAGLTVAASGLWLTLLHPDAPGGAWLWTVRLVVGSAMGASLVAGFAAIRRRDIAAHRAWMIRAYALGLGAGTQVLTEGFGEAALGAGDLSKALSLSAGWIINAALAEWVIRRPVRRRSRSALPGPFGLAGEPGPHADSAVGPCWRVPPGQRWAIGVHRVAGDVPDLWPLPCHGPSMRNSGSEVQDASAPRLLFQPLLGEERVHVLVDPLVLPPGALQMMRLTSHLEAFEERDDVVVPDVAIGRHTMLLALQEQVVE